ncbi:hypothetical protein C8J57DRAFT_407637 [Mycena rebaudengoi]|nr:hypothetical protein C8J57DRAFT_407637 [Mycena rebaudengoi]
MDPALAQLPRRLQSPARRALRRDGTAVEAMREIHEHLMRPRFPVAHLLPVFFQLLDVSDLPELGISISDTGASSLSSAGFCAFAVMKTLSLAIEESLLSKNDIPPEFWPRIWAWIVSQDYIVYKHGLDDLEQETELFSIQAALLSQLIIHPGQQMQPLIERSRPNVRAFIAQGWKRLVIEDSLRPIILRYTSRLLLSHVSLAEKSNFSELVSNVGGVRSLGSITIKWLHAISADLDARADSEGHYRCFMFISDILFALPTSDMESFKAEGLLRGLVVLAISLGNRLTDLSDTPHELAARSYGQCFDLITLALDAPYAVKWVLEAIRAKLLLALLHYGAHPISQGYPSSPFHTLLLRIIPGHLVHRCVVRCVERTLEKMRSLNTKLPGLRREFHESWERFVQTAYDWIVVRHKFAEREVPVISCDNGKVQTRKTSLWRCSRCRSIYYCSRACQTMDWTSGGHREDCHEVHSLETTSNSEIREFVTFRVNHDCVRHKHRILVLRASAMLLSPDPNYTVFDYTSGEMQVYAGHVYNPHPSLPAGILATAAANIARRGSAWISLVIFGPPSNPELRILPVLSSSENSLQLALEEIVQRFFEGKMTTDDYNDSIRALATQA